MSSTAADHSQKLSITSRNNPIRQGSHDPLTLSVSNPTDSWLWIKAIEISVPFGDNTRDLMKDDHFLSMNASVKNNSTDVAWNCSQTVVHGQCKITVSPPSPNQDGYALSTTETLTITLTFDVNPNAVAGCIIVTARAAATENGEYLEQTVELPINAIPFQVGNFNCTPFLALHGEKLVLSFEATEAAGFEIKCIGSDGTVYDIRKFQQDGYKYSTTFNSSLLANNLDAPHYFSLCNAQGGELLFAHIEFYTPFQISCPENLAFGSPLKLKWYVILDESSDLSLVANSFALRWNGGPPQPIQPVLDGDAYSLEIRVPSYIGIGNFQLQLSAQFQTQAGEELSSVSQIKTVSYQYLTITSTAASIKNENGWQITKRDISSVGYREALDALIAITMIQIPAGTFTMGSPESEMDSSNNERPQHPVTLPSFFLGQAPVTQAQWTVVAGWPKVEKDFDPSRFHFNGADLPVEMVSWGDAIEFCKRLSLKTGRHYTLPSEAQWEYACRAGSGTPFAFGETLTPDLANYDARYTYANGPKGEYRQQTTPVGMFPANAWGLHDMHGNVWEWCLDSCPGNYIGAPFDGGFWVLEESSHRLLRGGSWFIIPRSCRSAYRDHYRPDLASNGVGFRVVCLPQGPSLNP